ncbi:hypothetical protein MAPG_01885 [Magnaporthiopsis poae ATCC 64411]|uniref:Uncharacterized protein n=1 Tax=Magnaporthiopsis poae (strain ATCC 64411 / 73-15) TaxID=644358 RepID=A0A0C4DPV6_MAGP6|nr:hypothetical protein MAPG_01885 [Magnaporthiopsis poae ATCC 64411]
MPEPLESDLVNPNDYQRYVDLHGRACYQRHFNTDDASLTFMDPLTTRGLQQHGFLGTFPSEAPPPYAESLDGDDVPVPPWCKRARSTFGEQLYYITFDTKGKKASVSRTHPLAVDQQVAAKWTVEEIEEQIRHKEEALYLAQGEIPPWVVETTTEAVPEQGLLCPRPYWVNYRTGKACYKHPVQRYRERVVAKQQQQQQRKRWVMLGNLLRTFVDQPIWTGHSGF